MKLLPVVGLAVAIVAFHTSASWAKAPAARALFRPPQEGAEIIGSQASEWSLKHWMNSDPLSLGRLKGRVVLVRWWTAPECPFCHASAPALNEFHRLYADKGLVVVGIYHHKDTHPLNPREVEEWADRFGFQFPVAIDPKWQTLKRWWLQGKVRRWTSVSFLIDQEGVIRYIHPGGSYVKGDEAYSLLKSRIETLLNKRSLL